jgi:hypothetical protein
VSRWFVICGPIARCVSASCVYVLVWATWGWGGEGRTGLEYGVILCANRDPDCGLVAASLNPNVNLLGATPEEKALVDQWTNFSDTEIHAHTNFIVRVSIKSQKFKISTVRIESLRQG